MKQQETTNTPIQELEQEHHDKIVGIIAEKIEAERRPAPHGWKLVPAAPTPEMLEAGAKVVDWYAHNALVCYHAMLAVAPTPPAHAAPIDADVLLDALSNLEHDNYERSYNGSKNREADAALIRAALERHAAHVAAQPSGSCNGMPAYEGPLSAAQAPAASAEPLTETYVQTVPDKCDRIVWRGSYYHLPLRAVAQEPVASIKTLARYEPDTVYIGTGEYIAECVRADDGDYYLAADADAAIEALLEERDQLAAENARLCSILIDLKDWDCDVSGGFLSIPVGLRRRMQEAIDAQALQQDAAPAAQAPRACTCHPDDRPDGPCRERYAASECQALAAQAQAANADALEDYKKNGAAAVRFAPSSAHWSNELRRLFGSDARDGIDRLEERLRAAEQDAARWRFIRRRLCLTGNGNGTCAMQAINLPANISGWPEPGKVVEFCEEAIDAAIAAGSPLREGGE